MNQRPSFTDNDMRLALFIGACLGTAITFVTLWLVGA